MELSKRCIQQLSKRKYEGNYRELNVTNGLIDFTSNDYLGLGRDTEFHNQLIQSKDEPNLGSTGSRLLSGNNHAAEKTEKYLAELFKAEDTLILNSGYLANLAVLSSIPQRGDHILYDELCHASIKDGMRLSNAKYISFKHNDLNDLEIKLGKIDGEKYIVAESIYSMDGDQCPLEKLVDITEKYGAFLILDEAHATGLYGAYGGGISQLKKLEKKIFCRIYTFGKALGYHGAAVAGSKELKNFLINFARPLIYTTALPPGSYAIIKTGFDYIIKHPDLQITSQKITNVFINEFEMHLSNKFKRTNSNHPIQTVLVSGNERVKSLAEKLNKLGYDVRAILSPTVKQGQERLRVCLHNYNTEEEVIGLVKSLEEL